MSIYRIVNLLLEAGKAPACFGSFCLGDGLPPGQCPDIRVRYEPADRMNVSFEEITSVNGLRIGIGKDGWIYEDMATGCRMAVDEAYSDAVITEEAKENTVLWGFLLQLLLECRLLDEGVLTLHSCCIRYKDQAFAFSGPSGCGKSTRAGRWVEAFGAEYISGDRPAVDVAARRAYGAPWDGKERIFKNVSAPFGAVFQVERAETTSLRRLSAKQIRDFLIGQLFIPMWDTERAMKAIVLLSRFIGSVPVYLLSCDQDTEAAAETIRQFFGNQEEIQEESST